MNKETLEEKMAGIVPSQDTAQGKAVDTLITVKEDIPGSLSSDIELKSDLTDEEILTHTAGGMLGFFLESTEKNFSESANIMRQLIRLKERKKLSKNRQSRREIVEVARTPDMNMMGGDMSQPGVVRRFLTPRRKIE